MLRISARHDVVGVEVVGMLHRLRPPSMARSDYYWAKRDIVRWRPSQVSWLTALKYMRATRGLFHYHFREDAAVCAEAGDWQDALLCLVRATRVSLPHTLRHPAPMASVLRGVVATRDRGLKPSSATDH
jgi:hypothetical protein